VNSTKELLSAFASSLKFKIISLSTTLIEKITFLIGLFISPFKN
jgi:hypothetical protein